MPDYTIRNPHETIPLTEDVARTLGFQTARDSSGLLAAVYTLDGEVEAAEARAKGLVVEPVATAPVEQGPGRKQGRRRR